MPTVFSKEHHDSARPVALDSGTGKYVSIYKRGQSHVYAEGSFSPVWHGDELCYVTGRRGSGKSTFCSDYIQSYNKITDGDVYFISRFKSDPSIQLPKVGGHWVHLDKIIGFLDAHLGRKDTGWQEVFHDSLVVVDDIASSQLTPKQSALLHAFVIDLCENSRHLKCSLMLTSHQTTNYSKTRAILNECSSLVFFPRYSTKHQVEMCLMTYFGMTPKQVKELYDLKKTRWVKVDVVHPKMVLTQHELFSWKEKSSLIEED